jgi:uncharacterized protein YabE (DUF348 family)
VQFTLGHSFLGRLVRSRAILVGLTAVVIASVAGVTYGYAAMNKEVTLTLDGKTEKVSATGDTVREVLSSEGITVGTHDVVLPSPDSPVSDGSVINVRFGRPLNLSVDGDQHTYWVTATDVQGALSEIGRRFSGADLSISRGGSIDRQGLTLKIVTPKKLHLALAGKKMVTKRVPALTAADAVREMGYKIDKHDIVKPGPKHELQDGDTVKFTNIRVVKRHIDGETLPAGTIRQDDSSMAEGTTKVARDGTDGLRNVTYRIFFKNGHLDHRVVLSQKVLRSPIAEILKIGTQVAAVANFAGGSTVWDQLAQCESGGNWAANTGNGYYGGLQFNLGTWQSYGGSGLPSNASRETQIAIATKVRNASGGYGAWPACSASLGLPQ